MKTFENVSNGQLVTYTSIYNALLCSVNPRKGRKNAPESNHVYEM